MPPKKRSKSSWVPGPWLDELLSISKFNTFETESVLNGHIIKFHAQNEHCLKTTVSNLKCQNNFAHLSNDCLYHRIDRLLDKLKRLSKNFERNRQAIESFLAEGFNSDPSNPSRPSFPSLLSSSTPLSPSPSLPAAQISSPTTTTLISSPSSSLGLHTPAKQFISSPLDIGRASRRACGHCSVKTDKIKNLVSKVKSKKSLILEQRKLTYSIKDQFNTKHVNQSIRRKNLQVNDWKAKYTELKKNFCQLERKFALVTKRLNDSKKVNRQLEHNCVVGKKFQSESQTLATTVKRLKRQLASEANEHKKQEDFLRSQLPEKHLPVFCLKDDKRQYSHSTRNLYFWFLRENCPVEAVSLLVRRCAHLFEIELVGPLPSPATTAQMARELGVLADLQVKKNLDLY